MPNLLAAHVVSGCVNVASYFRVGKRIALQVLKSAEYSLSKVGDTRSTLDEVYKQTSHFVLACYGQPTCESLTVAYHKIWSSKISRSICGLPKLHSLPPTVEAFRENVARAHYQVVIWKHAHEQHLSNLEPLDHGWVREESSNSLVPKTVADISLAPAEILRLIRCSCNSSVPCRSKRCSCHNADLYGMHCVL